MQKYSTKMRYDESVCRRVTLIVSDSLHVYLLQLASLMS